MFGSLRKYKTGRNVLFPTGMQIIYSVSLRIQSECGKIRARITLNTDTFHAVLAVLLLAEKSGSSSLIFKVIAPWLSPIKFDFSNLLFPYIDHFKKKKIIFCLTEFANKKSFNMLILLILKSSSQF